MFIFCLSTSEPATIAGNTIRMTGGVGIEHRFVGATIAENSIEGGVHGIKTIGSSGAGSEIESNVIEGAEFNGILLENENNQVVGNLIEGSGKAGIRIREGGGVVPSPGNAIGGDSAAAENVISGGGGDAIEIVGDENTDEQIARNRGASNEGLFIDLGANGEGNSEFGPNDGIQPPKIDNAKLGGASGSGALPGATVRVFRKATASAGEIESFLAETEADGSGNWSVIYPTAIPGETQIAATQSGLEGTSELAFAKTEPAPQKDPICPDAAMCQGPLLKDGKPPETKIRKGPKAKTHATTAKFKFSSSELGSSFECKLDRKPFKPCKSPKKYKGLKPGRHVFKVRVIDKAGNKDPTPAKRKFKILG